MRAAWRVWSRAGGSGALGADELTLISESDAMAEAVAATARAAETKDTHARQGGIAAGAEALQLEMHIQGLQKKME